MTPDVMTELQPVSTKISQNSAGSSALSHPQLSGTTIFALRVTMLCALLAGGLESLYLLRQDYVSSAEYYALTFVVIGISGALYILLKFPGQYIDRIALTTFSIASIYIFTMLISGLFLNEDMARSLHAILWFHPAFIAVTLTQPMKIAQSASWLIIVLLTGVMTYFSWTHDGALLQSTLAVNHWIIILSLCASSALLYGLSLFRENQGADRARIEVLRLSEAALLAEVKEKEAARAGLQRANSVVTGFLNNLSHELRTPLNAIIGFSELIHGELFGAHANEKYKEYSGDVLNSGQHLLRLVDNLLYFSQVSAGGYSLDMTDLNVKESFTDAINAQRTAAAGADVEIIADAQDNLMLHADRTAIMRMLHGLIDNAIKFSYPGGKVTLCGRKGAEGACEISVRDSGRGIASAEREIILRPFQKGEYSEHNAIPGVGMGLALTRILMDLHHGSMSIDSAEKTGTCVTLVFPRHSNFPQEAKAS